MITVAEIQRVAAKLGIVPDVVDHDYALGCFLHFLAEAKEVATNWAFKGGTCLSKCHFANYRFSEDLDFTFMEAIEPGTLLKLLDAAKTRAQEEVGIKMDVRPTSIEVIDGSVGKESFEAKVYYEGVWRSKGSPRAIRIHANRGEAILFPIAFRKVSHPYTDSVNLPEVVIPTYSLEEIASEKLRAFSGQRIYAVARDPYDLWSLTRNGINIDAVISAFPEKCKAKGIDPATLSLERIHESRPEYELNWNENLEYLVPRELKCPFDEAWVLSVGLVERALQV